MVDIQGATLKSFTAYLQERTASTTGISMVPGLNGAGTNVVRSALHYANVNDYGADPTGVESSVAAFNLALATGKAVLFPAGTYLIDALVTTTFGRCIRGDGQNETKIVVDTASFLNIEASGTTWDFFEISDLTILADIAPETGAYCIKADGVAGTNRHSLKARNITIRGSDNLPVSAYGFMDYFWLLNLQQPAIEGVTIRGSFDCLAGTGLGTQKQTYGIRIEGQTIDPFFHDLSFTALYQGWYMGSTSEGFFLSDSYFVGVYNGITADNTAPGGWIDGVHVNAVRTGIYLKGRTGASVINAKVYRSDVFFDETVWDGIFLENCVRCIITGNDTATQTDAGTRNHYVLTNCAGVIGTANTANGSPGSNTVNSFIHTGTNTDVIWSANIINGTTNGFTIPTGDSDITLGSVEWLGTATNRYVVATEKTTIKINKGNLAYQDAFNVSSPSAADATDLRTVGTDSQFFMYNFAAGGAPYTYNIDLDSTGARVGDFLDFKIVTPSSTNATIVIRNGSGGATLLTLNTATSTRYFVRAVYTRGVVGWVIAMAQETLV